MCPLLAHVAYFKSQVSIFSSRCVFVMDLVQKMDLLCVEHIPDSNFAPIDPVIFNDSRVMQNMLDLEEKYIPGCNYFRVVQNDVQPFMRKVVTTWMLEVCEEQMCEDQVFPLAVNFMDRFLCLCVISRQQLQLLAATALLMASKIRQCHPLDVDLLVTYSDNSITPSELRSWEMLVLSKLRWDITAITGFDYVDHIVERMPWGRESPFIRRHSHTLVAICYTEPDFILCRPSLIATACVCAAVRGLNIPSARRAMEDICKLTRAEILSAEYVVGHIERVVAQEAEASQVPSRPPSTPAPTAAATSSKHASTPGPLDDTPHDEIRHPETPTDVQDVHF